MEYIELNHKTTYNYSSSLINPTKYARNPSVSADGMYDLTEIFTYENLDRLTTITQGTNIRNISYQSNGNINSKYDAGSYSYDPVKIHSISKITDTSCTSAIDQALQNITYTPFKKVKTIQQHNDSLIYTYGQDMDRRKMQLYENGQLVKNRIYCGMYEKETLADSTVKEYCYIAGGNGVTAVLINEDLYFLRRDVQGTITGLVNQNDTVVEEYSYDAWGRRRNPIDWTYDSVPQPQHIYRGYTFHEMLDEFGLINMNGRCYDPVVGRFLSPDIIVQNPNNTQCYNRYSYAINNPLKYSDPSGWSWTPIQAARHANMMANNMMMHLRDNFQPSVIRSGSSSMGNGYLFGSNAIIFQTAEATLQMALGDIAHILSSVFGMPGVFGNPGEDDLSVENSQQDPNSIYNYEKVGGFLQGIEKYSEFKTWMQKSFNSIHKEFNVAIYYSENDNNKPVFFVLPWIKSTEKSSLPQGILVMTVAAENDLIIWGYAHKHPESGTQISHSDKLFAESCDFNFLVFGSQTYGIHQPGEEFKYIRKDMDGYPIWGIKTFITKRDWPFE